MREIQARTENFKALTFFQRVLRFIFLSMDVVVVNKKTMPKLHAFVESLCKVNNLKMPTIFITMKTGVLNAAASKLFTSSGGIVIFQKMIKETSDEELEGIIAHEIGHIKYNHVNKTLAVLFSSMIASYYGINYLFDNCFGKKFARDEVSELFLRTYLPIFVASAFTKIAIGKSFEKQADEFAYHEMGKAIGLKNAFKLFIKKEEKLDASYDKTYELIQDCKYHVSLLDRFSLNLSYYLAKVGHLVHKGHKWIYHNTPYGPHPSPEARIATIEKYLEENPV